MRKFNFVRIMFAALAFAALFTACQKDQVAPTGADDAIELRTNTPSTPVSDGGVTPYIIPGYSEGSQGGNRTCEDVSIAFGCSFDNEGLKEDTPPLNGVQGPISWTSDGTYVTWTSTEPINVAVIVKGGPNANVYFYGCGVDDCTDGDSGLASPLVGSGNPAELSNITFCWTLCEPPVECEEETAFGGNYKGAGKAWWYYFDTTGPQSQSIYAGKNLTDGSVTYNDGYLTIILGSWQLQDVEEPVKIQAYDVLPTSRPAAGLFTTYKGDLLTVPVPPANFYVIHLDVELCE